MNIRYTLSAICLMASCALMAVPADPTPRTLMQPDGTTITVRLVGDEYSYYYRTMDGIPMVRNNDGWLVEAPDMPARDEQVRRQARVARSPQAAGYTAFPTTGSPHSLVILVGYKDLPFEQKRADFDALLNKDGYDYNGATGSCRDYYSASSFGQFTPYFDVYGPYTLENDMAFYGGQTGGRNDANAGAMVAEACQLAHDAGVDFSKYDTNDDGVLDNVFVYFAGHNQAEGASADAIWPHQGSVAARGVKLNGVLVDSYACTSEYRGSAGKIRCGIGTFCHEFGHVIGLPDFYDTNYKYYSVGNWDIMCSGSYNNQGRTPPTFTAYERFYEGWLEPAQLEAAGNYSLLPIEASNQAFLIAADKHNMSGQMPNPSEFFLLEYRDGKGWDSGLPGHGLLVWHIDYSSAAWTSNTPNNGIAGLMRMHLEEANGISWPKRSNGEGGRASDPYPGTSNITSFAPKLHNGTTLNYPVFDIQEQGGSLTFTFISSGLTSLMVSKQELHMSTGLNDNKKIVDWEPQMLTFLGNGLDPEQDVVLSLASGSRNGSYKLFAGDKAPAQSSNSWSNTLSLHVNNDSSLLANVWVSFIPASNIKRFICDETEAVTATLTAQTSGAFVNVALSGLAPRVSNLSRPVTHEATDITPYSFRISWDEVAGAEVYYINLYSRQPGESTVSQSFEDFNSPDAIRAQGWESSSNLLTRSVKSEGLAALQLKDDGDYIVTQSYPVAVSGISYWINAMATDVDTVGYLELEAHDGNTWKKLTETTITRRTKAKTIEHQFDKEAGYTRFRLVFYGKTSNGIAIDEFQATLSEHVTYFFQNDERPVSGSLNTTTLTDLPAGTHFYYQVCCGDLGQSAFGGCTDNISELSEPKEATTISIPDYLDDDKHLALAVDSINYDSKRQVVYVTAPKNGDALYIYDWVGNLVYSLTLQANQLEYPIPTERFVSGATYTIKYVEQGKLARKQRFVKAVFNR